MRRAIRCFAWTLIAASLLAPAAEAQVKRVGQINGIGLIDYSHPRKLHTGDWVRYHATGSSATGYKDDYTVTVAIVGEERFWGEDCFWVETVTERPGRGPVALATMMSYEIFKDPEALRNLQVYQRKMIVGSDDEGQPMVQLMKRPPESLKIRNRKRGSEHAYFDTLGTDTVMVPAGSFDVRRMRIRQASSTSGDNGDSTKYEEVHETRTAALSDRIPVTGLAREDIDYLYQAKTWLIGRSNDLPPLTLEHSVGRANLIAMGGGYVSNILKPEWQHDLVPEKPAAKPAAARRAATAAPKPKPKAATPAR
jgi:hypothetical protein